MGIIHLTRNLNHSVKIVIGNGRLYENQAYMTSLNSIIRNVSNNWAHNTKKSLSFVGFADVWCAQCVIHPEALFKHLRIRSRDMFGLD